MDAKDSDYVYMGMSGTVTPFSATKKWDKDSDEIREVPGKSVIRGSIYPDGHFTKAELRVLKGLEGFMTVGDLGELAEELELDALQYPDISDLIKAIFWLREDFNKRLHARIQEKGGGFRLKEIRSKEFIKRMNPPVDIHFITSQDEEAEDEAAESPALPPESPGSSTEDEERPDASAEAPEASPVTTAEDKGAEDSAQDDEPIDEAQDSPEDADDVEVVTVSFTRKDVETETNGNTLKDMAKELEDKLDAADKIDRSDKKEELREQMLEVMDAAAQ